MQIVRTIRRGSCLRIFIFLVCVSLPAFSHAFQGVTIKNTTASAFEGPAHHGLVIETDGILDPNLTAYEVHIKHDTKAPFPTWKVYNTELDPFDTAPINIPYRNGILSLETGKAYCIRIRAIYGQEISPWATKCGLKPQAPIGLNQDSDGDGMSDNKEYALGTDPNSADSDRDGVSDNEELADGSDPNVAAFPQLIVRTPRIDFGNGDPFGRKPNQHSFIEIDNEGDAPLKIQEVTVQENPNFPGGASFFFIGKYPAILSAIPPRNVAHIPVSFIPAKRGEVAADVKITSNNPEPVKLVSLKGIGTDIPDCEVSPTSLDFGTIKTDDQKVLVKYVTIANKPPQGDTQPPNIDTPFAFTLSTTVGDMVPGTRGFVLPAGAELAIPVLFQHFLEGKRQGFLEIRSAYCGVKKVELKGEAVKAP